MIKVKKDYHDAPDVLQSEEVRKLVKASSLDPEDSGTFASNIYAHYTVIKKLRQIYHDKCAYCESKIVSSPTLIDHYRPKDPYYWLAYEWSNLLPACERCHSSKNKSHFPLLNEERRIISPTGRTDWVANSEALLNEGPLLLNPEIDDPANYLAFHRDGRIYAIGNNLKGKKTIRVLNLNRTMLVSARKEKIDSYVSLFERQLGEISNLILRLGKKPESLKKEELDPLLNIAFRHPLNDLKEENRPEEEYALLAGYMLQNFNSFFVDEFEDSHQQEFLRTAFEIIVQPQLQLTESRRTSGIRVEKPKVFSAHRTEVDKIRINRLKIKNIKCFNEVDIVFQEKSNLIVGINGRGKSTILQLLALGLSKLDSPPLRNHWANVIKSGKEGAVFEIHVCANDERFVLKFVVDKEDKVKCVKNIEKYVKIKDRFLILAYGTSRHIERGDSLDERSSGVASLFGTNIYLKNIRDSDTYDYLKSGFEQIKMVTNNIFKLADPEHIFELSSFDTKNFYFKTPTNPGAGDIPLESMSDGFKSTFNWLFDMSIRAWQAGVDMRDTTNLSGVVLIDEIDNHLHPAWQRKLIPIIEEIFPNIQFIITSHSPFIVQSMTTDSVVLLFLESDGVRVSKIGLEGRPYGYEIEKIIELALGFENGLPEISDWLFSRLKKFELSVEEADKDGAAELYKEIKEAIPRDSGFNQYLDIMKAGLV